MKRGNIRVIRIKGKTSKPEEDKDITETKLLLQNDPSIHNNFAIRVAAINGHIETVKLLLQDPRIDPTAQLNEPIRYAAENGHIEVVKILLQNKRVNPAAENNYAIRYASQNGHIEIVKLLLKDHRVDPSDDNNWAIKAATQNGHTEIVKLLLKDERVDWRQVQNISIVQQILDQENKNIEEKLNQSYLSLEQVSERNIRKNISELGVYKGFYEEYCSNVPENLKIPPMKLVLIADKLKIEYDRNNINWPELCAKVRLRLDHLLD